jgi:adenylate cyclase
MRLVRRREKCVTTRMRAYYAANVVGRILESPGATRVVHNYRDIPGAIPIPATLSLELGKVISEPIFDHHVWLP